MKLLIFRSLVAEEVMVVMEVYWVVVGVLAKALCSSSAVDMVHASSAVVQAINHCPPPSQIFHGRKTILDSMHQFFAQDTRKQKRYVLYGLGGAGKTQIALKFIQESS
ncbi:hypothetical protein C8R45DRAFT_401896 [Mycena sanguinolenta]|nr:hypothetical protein C8R45DRAFT_401896 [Mycena sanguinolenta]